jgi:hypothetical protein
MSFQGDVAGIGLGELLQGLSRGERNGVLTLSGPKLSAAVGVRRGQLYLMAGPDEDDGVWRDRAVRAFAEDQDPQMESSRRATIARAARLETIYQMLEAGNLHFRFEPGPLPPPPSAGVKGTGALKTITIEGSGGAQEFDLEDDSQWGPGMPVEYLLLEHARISDELRLGAGGQLCGEDIVRALDPERHAPEVRDFLEQCDGVSTLLEIADRLGWPLSKARGVIGEYLQAGHVRIAVPRELLAAAQREMELGRAGRAATRLTGWLRRSPPGHMSLQDAQLLLGEWDRGRLQRVLPLLEPRVARTLLRKLDHLQSDRRPARERWKALAEANRQDEVALLHEVALRLSSNTEPDSRTFNDLLRLAHSFQQRGLERRTRMLLRLCASHLPERAPLRIDLGRRMLDAGLLQEGSRWLLNTARELLDEGDGETAMNPIRAVLRAIPDHGEARALLEKAREVQAKRKRRRFNVTIGLAAGLVLSLAALVKFQSYREVQRWVRDLEGQSPADALLRLDEQFHGSPPARIAELRARLLERKNSEERSAFEEWSERYREAEEACKFGDPSLGLSKALDLPGPPPAATAATPDASDLLGLLASRLGQKAKELDLPVDAPLEALNEEERLSDLLGELLVQLASSRPRPEASSFQFRVQELREEILARRETRALEREKLMAQQKAKDQDILLATARAHAQAGDLERSLGAYERLLATDQSLAQIGELQKEIAGVRAHFEALKEALRLAEAGDHAGARDALDGVCPRPVEHLLPYRVESVPAGARVSLSDGRVRTAPFQSKSGFGERVKLVFSLPGYQERTLELQEPRNLRVFLHRFPERVWASPARVEAAPVPAGDDHVVCDRRGRVARIDSQNRVKWEVELKTLGGIARTPAFLPSKSAWLLVVSEDGQVWFVQSQTGELEGPRDIGSPPAVGPVLTRSGVSVQFADGRVGVWSDRLEPLFYQADSLVGREIGRDALLPGNLSILRRGVGSGNELTCPWNGWGTRVRADDYQVASPDGRGFTAERKGEWTFVAWEAPKALAPHGRLWVSDEGGLRSYLPDPEQMVYLGGGDAPRSR